MWVSPGFPVLPSFPQHGALLLMWPGHRPGQSRTTLQRWNCACQCLGLEAVLAIAGLGPWACPTVPWRSDLLLGFIHFILCLNVIWMPGSVQGETSGQKLALMDLGSPGISGKNPQAKT